MKRFRVVLLSIILSSFCNAAIVAAFTTKATSLNIPVTLLNQHVSHKEINESLEVNVHYTQAVDYFIETLLSKKARV